MGVAVGVVDGKSWKPDQVRHDVKGTTPPWSKSFFGSFFSKKELLSLL
jgi:hypothetical protein